MYNSKQATKDEKQVKDFMIAKYEKKTYYSDPVPQKLQNGFESKPLTIATNCQVN